MTASAPVRSRAVGRVAIGVGLLLPFLWQIYGAISNLRAWMLFAEAAQGQLSAFAWVVLIAGIVIPVAGYGLGLGVGLRGGAARLALALLLALCASEALTLSQLAFFLSSTRVL